MSWTRRSYIIFNKSVFGNPSRNQLAEDFASLASLESEANEFLMWEKALDLTSNGVVSLHAGINTLALPDLADAIEQIVIDQPVPPTVYAYWIVDVDTLNLLSTNNGDGLGVPFSFDDAMQSRGLEVFEA